MSTAVYHRSLYALVRNPTQYTTIYYNIVRLIQPVIVNDDDYV